MYCSRTFYFHMIQYEIDENFHHTKIICYTILKLTHAIVHMYRCIHGRKMGTVNTGTGLITTIIVNGPAWLLK